MPGVMAVFTAAELHSVPPAIRIRALPEQAALPGAARLLGRSVAWQAGRSESNLSEPAGRRRHRLPGSSRSRRSGRFAATRPACVRQNDPPFAVYSRPLKNWRKS